MTNNSGFFAPTRRRFIQGTSLAGASLLLPAGLLSGRAQAATPQRGGTLRVAMSPGSTSDTLDPMTYTDSPQFAAGFTLANCLVEIDKDKKPVPELAESWDSSDAFKRWSFKLRSGVTFHNGKTLSAADVVYSLKRHIAKGSTSAAAGLLADIDDIVADGDLTVQITHKTGTPDLPIILGDFHLLIIPEGFTDFANFIGTGPYKLVRFEPGVVLETQRNENYWKPDRAFVDKFDLVFVNDDTAAANALMTGEVQGVSKLNSQIAKRLKAQGSVNLITSEGGSCTNIDMNCQSKLFSDNNARLALKSAIDRKKMVEFVGAGFGAIGNDNPIPPNDPFFNKEIKQREYDPEKAKFYLKKAGLDKLDLSLQVSDAAYSGAVDSAALLQESASKGGINISIKREPSDGYWSNVWLKSEFMVAYFGTRPTPDMMFSVFYKGDAPWNESHWKSEKFDKLLVAGRQTDDFAKRKEIYDEMQQMAHDESGIAIFMLPSIIDAYAPEVQGVEPDGVRTMMGARIAERAWIQA
ncbi:ABC transporter substrate-binding protein [Rhizobium sp. 16-449-1b]|uniref:ABC transporter substrate-binding protein n=1 Tax=Rhizobium sp. 16-449-1b TaxID=2819989 RepID=UPI001ADBFEED|nr:ABC transporter substrate-binding protein [Rhizobium sp. 16-449-1b]MBO9195425.1 ABC transporter substrate-binding protein [Rhizobium sp. 16-449-1b]